MKVVIRLLLLILFLVLLGGIIISMIHGHRDLPLNELKEKYAGTPSSFISVEGMEVHYRDEGNIADTLPIVLIHGTGASLHTFDDWTDQLKKDYRVIRMDLPAFGLTGPFPNRTYTIEQYVNFVEQFLSTIGVNQCILGGNSLGGEIAWRFTLENPEQVDKLILIDAAGYPYTSESKPLAFKLARLPVISQAFTFLTPKSVVRKSIESTYADKTKVSEPLVDRYFELALRVGNRQAFVDRMQLDDAVSPFHLIKEIQQPTLILWGEEDLLIPTESAHRFQNDLPNNTLVVLENIGHVPMEESPAESLVPVLSFLRK